MMIRINLLPVRKKVQQEAGRQILALLAFVLLGAAVGNFFWYSDRDGIVTKQREGLDVTRRRIADLEKTIGEVKNINNRKAEVEKKLAVLDSLRRGRSGPVRMLDAMASSLPKKAWIRTFTETQSAVVLVGSAVSHDDVAELIRNLKGMVWTPKGIGRLVEQRREAKTSRVELLTADASIEEFPVADIKPFFSNVDLKKAEQKGQATKPGEVSTVDFDITLAANYAI